MEHLSQKSASVFTWKSKKISGSNFHFSHWFLIIHIPSKACSFLFTKIFQFWHLELKYKYPEFLRIIPSPKQSVNNLPLLQIFIAFRDVYIYIYILSTHFLARKKSSSNNLTNLLYIYCAALTLKFNKASRSCFYC